MLIRFYLVHSHKFTNVKLNLNFIILRKVHKFQHQNSFIKHNKLNKHLLTANISIFIYKLRYIKKIL